MILFRIITFLLPFLKEVILGKNVTILQAAKEKKIRLFVLAIVLLSITINIYILPNHYKTAEEYIRVKKQLNYYESRNSKPGVPDSVTIDTEKEPYSFKRRHQVFVESFNNLNHPNK